MEFPYCKVSNLGLNVTIKGLHHMRILQDFSKQLCYILWNTCEERHIPSEIHYSKKKLYGPFLWIGFNCLKAIETLRGDSLLFTTSLQKFLVIIWANSEGWKSESSMESLSIYQGEK